MKNDYIYRVQGIIDSSCDWSHGDTEDLGFWLSFGTAKADLKRLMENGILKHYFEVWIEQIQIGRYHVPFEKLRMIKRNNKWVNKGSDD